MSNGDAQKLLLDPHDAAEFLDMHEQTLARWRVEGSGPIFVRIGTKIRYHRHDLEKYLASRRVEPIDAILDEIPDELRAAVRKALPQIRREAPHAFDVFTAVTKYDPDAIESTLRAALSGARSYRFRASAAGLPEAVEVCGVRIEAERLRNRELQKLNGRGDPLWAVSNIIDVALWSLIEPTLNTGVIWIAAKKNQGYRFSSADARSYWPYFGARGGYAPITVALFEELLEASADFRRDLSDGTLRQVEPNGSMK